MSAPFRDTALGKDDDAARGADFRKTMRNQQCDAVLRQFGKRGEDLSLGYPGERVAAQRGAPRPAVRAKSNKRRPPCYSDGPFEIGSANCKSRKHQQERSEEALSNTELLDGAVAPIVSEQDRASRTLCACGVFRATFY